MAAESVMQYRVHNKRFLNQKSCRRMTALFWFSVMVMVVTLAACSKTVTELTPLMTSTPHASPTIKSTITQSSTLTPTCIPSPTQNPFGTQIGSTLTVPEESLFEPFDAHQTYYALFENLPPGLYLVDRVVGRDNNSEELLYVSIRNSNRGHLLSIEDLVEFLYLKRVFFDHGETRILGGYPGTASRYLFDLSDQVTSQFTICNEGLDELNPSGRFLATICNESGQVQSGKIFIEILSFDDETGFTLEIPSHSDKRYASNRIHWVGDDNFIAHVGLNEEPCLINISDLGMRCAPELEGKPLLSISPLGTYLLTNRSTGYTWIKDIHRIDCFLDQSKCDPIVTLDDERTGSSSLYWSPDETMLAVDFGDHLTSTTAEIGYYDTETWTYHQVAIFPRSSGFFEWCPDSSCMIIVGDPSYILYLDGTREEIPHDLNNPIAVIEVP